MCRRLLYLVAITALVGALVVPAFAQDSEMATHQIVRVSELEFADIQPEGFDPGMKIASLLGDPSVADEPYVIRLSFEEGYRFPPHYHPKAENLTVLSGELLLAMGEMADESQLQSYTAGDVLHIPPTHPHFGGAATETVIQLHGVGPFEILLVNPPTAVEEK